MVQKIRYIVVDVFTSQRHLGNPLAIVFLPETDVCQDQKQIIAREFNLSETVFVHPNNKTSSSRIIDIFTVDKELPFAGHPTVGVASWLLEHSSNESDNKVEKLITKSGPLSLTRSSLGVGVNISHSVRVHSARVSMSEILNLHPSLEPFFETSDSSIDFPVFSIVKGMNQVLVELPNTQALASVEGALGSQTLPCVTASKGGYLDEGWDVGSLTIYFYVSKCKDTNDEIVIRSRMFINNSEDPATGSAASGLACYMALSSTGNQTSNYHIVQGVEMGRRSDMYIKVSTEMHEKENSISSVEISGTTAQFSSGELLV